MVKQSIFVLMLLLAILTSVDASDVFERNCVACHKPLPSTLQQMFKRYLLIYGGEENFKAGLKFFLQNPSLYTSAMSALFVDTIGIKEKMMLDEKELIEAIDIYWEKYKVFGKLK
jgi:hypothetical protein